MKGQKSSDLPKKMFCWLNASKNETCLEELIPWRMQQTKYRKESSLIDFAMDNNPYVQDRDYYDA